jgi:hypothetical protein
MTIISMTIISTVLGISLFRELLAEEDDVKALQVGEKV